MASTCRYVDGDVNLIEVAIDSVNYSCEKGDLMYMHPGSGTGQGTSDNTARSANFLNAEGSEEKDQLGFAQYFLGVANEKVGLQSGETTFRQDQNRRNTVQICTTGRFEFDCPAQAWYANQPVGIYSTGAGTGYPSSPQKVDKLAGGATKSAVIGRAIPTTASLGTFRASGTMNRVVVDIMARNLLGTAEVAGTYTGTSGQ
jgi:hypothetical protein